MVVVSVVIVLGWCRFSGMVIYVGFRLLCGVNSMICVMVKFVLMILVSMMVR